MSRNIVRELEEHDRLQKELKADLIHLIRRQTRMENYLNKITPDLDTIFDLACKGIDPYTPEANKMCKKICVVDEMIKALWKQYTWFRPRADYMDLVRAANKEG